MILTGYPYAYAVNSTAMTTRIGFFQCPSDTEKPFDVRSSTVGAVLSGVPALVDLEGKLRRELGEHRLRPGPAWR